MTLDHVQRVIFLRTELAFRTRHRPQEVFLTLVVAGRVVGGRWDLLEHLFAGSGLVEDRPVAVVLEEVATIENGQGDRLRGCDSSIENFELVIVNIMTCNFLTFYKKSVNFQTKLPFWDDFDHFWSYQYFLGRQDHMHKVRHAQIQHNMPR